MKICVGADHRGTAYKELVKAILCERGHEIEDMGVYSDGPADFPDYAFNVAKAVQSGAADRGVLICASGIGMSMAANRFRGIRATLCLTPQMAVTARRHNDSNILCLGQDTVSEQEVRNILEAWLDTEFEGGRHERRLARLDCVPD